FRDRSRTASSLRASISARICSTVSRTLASAALTALASIPRLRWRGMAYSFHPPLQGEGRREAPGWGLAACTAPPGFAALATLPLQGRVSLFDRLRVDRRAGAAGDDERRAAEEKLVDAVVVTILRELF